MGAISTKELRTKQPSSTEKKKPKAETSKPVYFNTTPPNEIKMDTNSTSSSSSPYFPDNLTGTAKEVTQNLAYPSSSTNAIIPSTFVAFNDTEQSTAASSTLSTNSNLNPIIEPGKKDLYDPTGVMKKRNFLCTEINTDFSKSKPGSDFNKHLAILFQEQKPPKRWALRSSIKQEFISKRMFVVNFWNDDPKDIHARHITIIKNSKTKESKFILCELENNKLCYMPPEEARKGGEAKYLPSLEEGWEQDTDSLDTTDQRSLNRKMDAALMISLLEILDKLTVGHWKGSEYEYSLASIYIPRELTFAENNKPRLLL